jgi:hypothetical protein
VHFGIGERDAKAQPDLLPILVVADLFGIGRTLAYQAAREGSIPAIRVGSLWLVSTKWVLEQLQLTPEELAQRLPDEAWSPARKIAKGGRKKKDKVLP